jgi:hypothetical protein
VVHSLDIFIQCGGIKSTGSFLSRNQNSGAKIFVSLWLKYAAHQENVELLIIMRLPRDIRYKISFAVTSGGEIITSALPKSEFSISPVTISGESLKIQIGFFLSELSNLLIASI